MGAVITPMPAVVDWLAKKGKTARRIGELPVSILENGGAVGYVAGLIKACVFGPRVAEHAARRRG